MLKHMVKNNNIKNSETKNKLSITITNKNKIQLH